MTVRDPILPHRKHTEPPGLPLPTDPRTWAPWRRRAYGDLRFATRASCLAVIELSVNWEAEKLYGVEGLGPFDEF